jgi:cathepsin L
MSYTSFLNDRGARSYMAPGSDEYLMREKLFLENAARVMEHNCNPVGPWEAGVTKFADWTPEEMKMLYGYNRNYRSGLGLNRRGHSRPHLPSRALSLMPPKDIAIPLNLSYEDVLSKSGMERDQGGCGSCWAFGSTTSMRARALMKGQNHDFSVAQITSCAPNPQQCGGAGGCQGSTSELAFDYVIQAGVTTGKQWPYKPTDETCPSDMKVGDGAPGEVDVIINEEGGEEHRVRPDSQLKASAIGMIGWTKLPENKELPLLRALVAEGPVPIVVAAGTGWSYYMKGVMTKDSCDPQWVLNHIVTLFGYGETSLPSQQRSMKYWHIRNSWGPDWGEEGNFRLERLDKEEEYCGWNHEPEKGTGCKGGPPKVKVCGSCGILYDPVVPHFERKA